MMAIVVANAESCCTSPISYHDTSAIPITNDSANTMIELIRTQLGIVVFKVNLCVSLVSLLAGADMLSIPAKSVSATLQFVRAALRIASYEGLAAAVVTMRRGA